MEKSEDYNSYFPLSQKDKEVEKECKRGADDLPDLCKKEWQISADCYDEGEKDSDKI